MKAAQISEYGDASVVQVVDIDRPQVSEQHVLVEVHAASLNPFDTMVREGYLRDSVPLELPVTLGGDIAGIVTEVGKDVTHLQVGDRVYGQANVVAGNSGAFAEHALTKATQVATSPKDMEFTQAASLPLVGVSALQALTEHVALQSGQKLFIHGGAGGIGTIAIQIAKNLGAYVATTATGEGMQTVKALGADEVIDYKTERFTEKLQDYDAVFDTVGGDDFNNALSILKPGGTAVSMLAQADEERAKAQDVTAITQSTQVTTERLNALRDLVESGVVAPQVGKTFQLDDVRQAFLERENGHTSGKIVLTIAP